MPTGKWFYDSLSFKMKIIPLTEGAFTIDKTKLFVPFDDSTDDLQQRPLGSLLVEIQPFVVLTSKDIILLDTGLGFADNKSGKLQLHSSLERVGIAAEKVTKVLMSHLHKDHAGGISMLEDRLALSLPLAKYYTQKRELDYAFDQGLPSYIPEELIALKQGKRVVQLNEDKGTIDDYIDFELTGAHCPWHQVFWIREGKEVIFFGGDVAPQQQQMRMRYKTKYDFDPGKAMELRKLWWEQGNKDKWSFLFYHDIKTPIYTS
ncbi:MAG: hypothetical protein NVS1B13_02880 [Flavisolibacter sp.]